MHGLTIVNTREKTPVSKNIESSEKRPTTHHTYDWLEASVDTDWTSLKPTSPYIPDLSAQAGLSNDWTRCSDGGFRHGIVTTVPIFDVQKQNSTKLKVALDALHPRGVLSSKRIVKAKRVFMLKWKIGVFRPTELSFHMMPEL